MNRHAKAIIKCLDRVTASGHRQSQIFDDWLDMVHASLSALPAHLKHAVRSASLATDTPEAQELFKRLQESYPKAYCWEAFAEAFAHLLNSTRDDVDGSVAWDDTIGQVYMEWGIPNKHSGQFFTPYPVAQAMADMSMGNIEEEIYRRLEEAYLKTPTGAMHRFMSPERVSKFVRTMGEHLVPICVEHIEPIKVSDPACGSGVMFLAAAERTPRWALNWGLVTFSGMDIDRTCVRMAQVNTMLYGLNGFNIQCALAIAEGQQDEPIAVDLPSFQVQEQA